MTYPTLHPSGQDMHVSKEFYENPIPIWGSQLHWTRRSKFDQELLPTSDQSQVLARHFLQIRINSQS
jgi:hypothetical protein